LLGTYPTSYFDSVGEHFNGFYNTAASSNTFPAVPRLPFEIQEFNHESEGGHGRGFFLVQLVVLWFATNSQLGVSLAVGTLVAKVLTPSTVSDVFGKSASHQHQHQHHQMHRYIYLLLVCS
jgi:hypothetical protein